MTFAGPTRSDLADWPNGPETAATAGEVKALLLEGPMLFGQSCAPEGWWFVEPRNGNPPFAVEPATFAALYQGISA